MHQPQQQSFPLNLWTPPLAVNLFFVNFGQFPPAITQRVGFMYVLPSIPGIPTAVIYT